MEIIKKPVGKIVVSYVILTFLDVRTKVKNILRFMVANTPPFKAAFNLFMNETFICYRLSKIFDVATRTL